jgi:hydrogenase maturation protease
MHHTSDDNLFLVLGMGNPLLCDDSIGLRVVESAEKTICGKSARTAFKKNYSGGIDLLYDLVGFHKALIVDSLVTGNAPAGYCHEFSLTSIDKAVREHCVFAHGISMSSVFRIGAQCGYPMPDETVILAIESHDVTTFSEELSPSLEASMEGIIRKIIATLSRWGEGVKRAETALPARRPATARRHKGNVTGNRIHSPLQAIPISRP